MFVWKQCVSLEGKSRIYILSMPFAPGFLSNNADRLLNNLDSADVPCNILQFTLFRVNEGAFVVPHFFKPRSGIPVSKFVFKAFNKQTEARQRKINVWI